MRRPLKLVVLGMMGRVPFAGQTWLYLNWLRGLSGLGHDVYYVEDDSVWPYDPRAATLTDDCGYAITHIARNMEAIGLAGRWAFRLCDREHACWGMPESSLEELYASCDALLNIVGAVALREEMHLAAPVRVYVETDPVVAELKVASGDEGMHEVLSRHTVLATYGENYGSPDCRVPLNGRPYVFTRQPVDLNLWPMVLTPEARFFTTVGNYRQEGSDIEWDGSVYSWSKHHEWERFAELPAMSAQELELALMHCEGSDRERMTERGWRIVSPTELSLDPWGAYRHYIQSSRGEFTVAKDQNVRLRSGWFSERAVCYLASGKPVITQDTGFANVLPTGEGLFAVADVEQAAEAVERVNADYRRHCRAARAIAAEHFEARAVAARLLAEVGLS
jgi:hypothetical protein